MLIEYKRHSHENVINQGLFYLDWLLDHKAEFRWLVMEKLGKAAADQIEWSAPRLLCIAQDFTRYDLHAVEQMHRSIELIRYRRFGGELLLLELVNAPLSTSSGEPVRSEQGITTPASRLLRTKTVTNYIAAADDELTERYEALRDFLNSLGDDVQEKTLKHYVAFKRLKNFACVQVHIKTRNLIVWLRIDPDSLELEEGFTRDVSQIGHAGTGDVELTLSSMDDLERAKSLLRRSYAQA